MSRGALVVALMTLAVFIPTQLGLENKITVKLREVKLACRRVWLPIANMVGPLVLAAL